MRIKRLEIENFKCIDHLELDFPKPDFMNEPDVFVIGSRNGVGKTSVLEAIFLLLWYHTVDIPDIGNNYLNINSNDGSLSIDIDMANYVYDFQYIKTGMQFKNNILFAKLHRDSYHTIFVHSSHTVINPTKNEQFFKQELVNRITKARNESSCYIVDEALNYNNANVFLSPVVLYFHSNRFVSKGKMSLSDLTSNDSSKVPNVFKETMINLILGKHGIFEGTEIDNDSYEKLSLLIKEYANGEIGKMRNPNGNSLGLMIKLNNSEESIPFDLLSSGQKEIISTLFTIWYHTREYPCIVLIDEPELHLNPAWKYSLVDTLYELAPQNQYILATHSKEIFESVDESKRIELIQE